jgi:hypothetical protein
MLATLVWVVVICIVAGLLLWLLSQLSFIDATMRQIIRAIVIVIVVIWLIFILLGAFGISFPR